MCYDHKDHKLMYEKTKTTTILVVIYIIFIPEALVGSEKGHYNIPFFTFYVDNLWIYEPFDINIDMKKFHDLF